MSAPTGEARSSDLKQVSDADSVGIKQANSRYDRYYTNYIPNWNFCLCAFVQNDIKHNAKCLVFSAMKKMISIVDIIVKDVPSSHIL